MLNIIEQREAFKLRNTITMEIKNAQSEPRTIPRKLSVGEASRWDKKKQTLREEEEVERGLGKH